MTRRAEASIHYNRNGCLLDDDLDLRTRFNTAVAADRRPKRHHRGRADVLQTFREHGIGVDVRKNSEPFLHQNFRRRECLNRIGQQVARVWMNLEFDPCRQTCARRQAREAHGLPAFRAPLVFGRRRKRLGSMKSRMFANGSCLPERSARRSATVTSSVPLAVSASRINSFDANFPVPTSRRDANSRSAIFSFEGLSAMEKDKRIHGQARMSM